MLIQSEQGWISQPPQPKLDLNRLIPRPSRLLVPAKLYGYDVVNKADATRSIGSGSVLVNRIGRGIYGDGATGINLSGACAGQTFSRVCEIIPVALPSGSNTISNSTTDNISNGSQWYVNSAGVQGLNKANAVAMGSAASGIALNKLSRIGVTYDGATVKYYAEGHLVGTTAAVETFLIDSSARFFSRAGTDEPFAGYINLHADWASQVLSETLMKSLTQNLWQIFEPDVISVYFAAAGGAAALAGNAAATAASSAQLTTAIPVAGASVSQATTSGIFTTALTFQGSASAGVNVAGDFFTQIKFDGVALAQALVQAGLSNGIRFAAAAAAQAGGGGDITIQINFLGAAVANTLVQGTLNGGASGFEGAAAGRASSSAQLTTAIPVEGNVQAYANSVGGLTTILPLNSVVAAVNNVSGDLSVAIRFNAQALAQALASADFTVQIRLNGAALAQAAVSGTLAGTAPMPSLNPRYTVDIEPRLYVVESAPRLYEVAM